MQTKKKERKFEVPFCGSSRFDSGHGDLSELFNCKINSTTIDENKIISAEGINWYSNL